jgi:hypothetical protein
MDQEDARRRFERLPPNEQLRVLAIFGHGLTIAARDTYEMGGTGLRWPERLRNINEVQHRVLAHIRALLLGDPKRYPDGILLSILFEHGDEHLRGQTLSALEDALNRAAAQQSLQPTSGGDVTE